MRRNQYKAEKRTDSWSGMLQSCSGTRCIHSWVFQTTQTSAIDPSALTHVGEHNFYHMFSNCHDEEDKKQHNEL